MEAMLKEGIYDEIEVQQRLLAVFGRVNTIRKRIDEALENDDIHRRRREMRVLPLPRNFPEPQSMGQSLVPTWIRWIREESERIVSELEEEIKRRNDPDDPFDGTASGIYEPLEHGMRTPLILLLEEKKLIQHKRKTEKSRLLLQNNVVDKNARISVQMTQPNQHKKTEQSKSQVVQNGRSDYSRTSPQGERQVERSSMQRDTEVQRQTRPAEERLIDYSFVPQYQQIVLNGM